MGYFGKQIYNEPESMYVDPKLEILANSLASVQKRHDENYATMSALDLMAHNTKVAEGDKGIKDAALGRLKTQRDAIAATGDYAYAMPRIGAAVKDWSADETLNMAKDNEIKRQKSLEQLSALGSSGLDFNKATKNWTTIDPLTGKPREFISGVEKQEDWDKTAQDVTKLMADQRPIGLSKAAMEGYLMHGTTGGINPTKIENYIGKAYDRFVNGTTAGKQMFRKLTEIDGVDPKQAALQIKHYLNNVGQAQAFTKTDLNYQADVVAMKKMEIAADIAKARIKAGGEGSEGGAGGSYYTSLAREATRTDPSGVSGTSIKNEDAQRLFGAQPIKVKTSQGDIDAMYMTGDKTISPTKLVPGMDRLPDDIMTKGKAYHNTINNYNSKISDIDNQIKTLQSKTTAGGRVKPGEELSTFWEGIKNIPSDIINGPQGPVAQSEINSQINALRNIRAGVEAKRESVRAANSKYVDLFEKKKDIFVGAKSNLIQEAGKAIQKLNIPSIVDQTQTKNFNIKDGQGNVSMVGFPKASDLLNLGENKVNMLIESGALIGVKDFDQVEKDAGNEGKSGMPESGYQLHYSTKMPLDLNKIHSADMDLYKNDKDARERAPGLKYEAAQFFQEQSRLTSLVNDKADTQKGRRDLANMGVDLISRLPISEADKKAKIADYKSRFSKFNGLPRYEQEQLLQEALMYEQMANQYNSQLQ